MTEEIVALGNVGALPRATLASDATAQAIGKYNFCLTRINISCLVVWHDLAYFSLGIFLSALFLDSDLSGFIQLPLGVKHVVVVGKGSVLRDCSI